jgi:hypothetical protein
MEQATEAKGQEVSEVTERWEARCESLEDECR